MATQVDICNLALTRIGATNITAIDDGSKNATHCNTFWDYILDEVLEDYSWNFAKKTVTLNYTSGFGIYSTSDTKTITAITQADPAQATSAAHGWLGGQTIYLTDIVGMTELNDKVYEVGTAASNTVTLLDIDSTDMTAYTSGGTGIRMEVDERYRLGYTYDLPTDYLKALYLSDKGFEFEILGTGNNQRLCTTSQDAILTYTALESTTTNMINRFISAMAWRLAAELSIPLSKKGAKFDWAMGMYVAVTGRKTAADAQSQKQKFDDSDPWLEAGGFTV